MPFWLRVTVLGAGWFLVLFGLVGMFLPVVQGALSLILGLALLSAASQTVHLKLRSLFGRWPQTWKRLERLRRRLHGWLSRLHRRSAPAAIPAAPHDPLESDPPATGESR